MQKTYTRTYQLTAADCNAQFELPLWTLGQNIVEVATDHANLLGVGYKRLQEDENAWVLMRMAMYLKRMPRVNETYRIDTWVSSFNRRFSEREFEVLVGDESLGFVHTVWTVINSRTRQGASLDGLENLAQVITERAVEMPRGSRLRPADFADVPVAGEPYRVAVSDIDTNRHLTAMRYVQLMLNCLGLKFFDENIVTRFEIAYSNEAHYADLVATRAVLDADAGRVMLSRADEALSMASIGWRSRS